MMRYLLSICALFLLNATFIAQTPKKVENWQVFSPISDEFSVDTPLMLEQRGDNDPKSSRKYSGTINGVFFFVFSDPLKKQNESQKLFLEMVREALPSIGMPSDFGLADMNSGGVSFKDTFGYWQHLRLFRDGKRTYIAQAVALDVEDEAALRFIRSFSVSDHSQGRVAQPTPPNNIPLKVLPGSGVIPVRPTTPTSGNGSGLKVLSKPRPSYTDLARKYGIQGTVIVEVEFLASGEIGSVKAVTQLPFGLTQSAIDAVRGVTFQPAIENGVPVSVTKKLEYSYAIY